MPARVLILGGTSDARALATILARRSDLSVVVSLAGRTSAPAAQPVPVHSGGFGGIEGLVAYLAGENIDVLVDATHPFARRISANAVAAASRASIPLIVLKRPPWIRQGADRWLVVATMPEAASALGPAPKRVFLAIGRNEIAAFEAARHHTYLLRSVDPVASTIGLPRFTQILSRGPFAVADEVDLLRRERIAVVVSKNSGGAATFAKIEAARRLELPIVMVARPPDPPEWVGLDPVETVEAVLARLDHARSALAPRGV